MRDNYRHLDWTRALCASRECPEVARDGQDILLRSSTTPNVVLRYTEGEWDAFLAGVRGGEFDGIAR